MTAAPSPGRDSSSSQASSFTRAETTAMRRALEAALEGPRGANPLVGAALLDADVVGRRYAWRQSLGATLLDADVAGHGRRRQTRHCGMQLWKDVVGRH